jgi:hypothetical protein
VNGDLREKVQGIIDYCYGAAGSSPPGAASAYDDVGHLLIDVLAAVPVEPDGRLAEATWLVADLLDLIQRGDEPMPRLRHSCERAKTFLAARPSAPPTPREGTDQFLPGEGA